MSRNFEVPDEINLIERDFYPTVEGMGVIDAIASIFSF